MKSRIRKHIKLVYLFTIIIGVFSALHGLIQFDIPDTVSGGIRWVGIVGLLVIGINSNKLTTWIFISMFIGAEIGYDFPVLGNELNVLSKIFIKLINKIILDIT